MTVIVSAKYNKLLHERQVFGINPDDLEECDLPDESEEVGAMLTQEEVNENIDILRVTVRPDLFYLDENGKAIRKDDV